MVAETPEITVRDNAEAQVYDALIGDQVVGSIVYERSGQRLVFSHTIVEPEFRGRGIGTVLVTKALPRRWGPVLGALLVALALAHNLFAQTLTISRYYG